ncbi:MAG: hypothetical protein AAF146_06975 [Bacteroidota bacterium]
MHQSRLVEVFQYLDKRDLRHLEKFVASPYFNQRQDVIDLFHYLRKQHPFPRPKTLERRVIFAALFPDQDYDEKQLGYTFSFLFKTVKAFLAYEEMRDNPVVEQTHLCRALRKRGIKRVFEGELKVAKKLVDNQPLRNADYHFFHYQLALEQYSVNSIASRHPDEVFTEMTDHFGHYFIANRLRLSSAALSQQTVAPNARPELLLDEVLQHTQTNDYSHIPAISIYYHTYKALTETDSTPYFQQLRQLVQTQQHRFAEQEIRDIYVLAINYCIRQINAGQDQFLTTLFEIYKEGLANAVFITNGVMSRFTYKNIAMAGLGLKEYQWVEDFLFRYQDRIEKKYRESTFNYNLAILYYRQPDYHKAMKLLQQADFDDPLLNVNARRMLLTIYYSEQAYDALQSHLDSFKNYIYRHPELGYHRTLNLNLIRFTKKLLHTQRYDTAGLAKLRQEIEATQEVAEKPCLLEQVRGDG